ncbi:UBX domain-containing protein 11-like [Diadema setosum]|uniref:UBX domain-containing protein 11-like n=1 Tax=Diadema setosum TaxID=31175 RepID=UPI003B3ADE67
MSDPSSSLRKNKKMPLPGVKQPPGQRSVPFRNQPADFLATPDLDDMDDILHRTSSRLSTTSIRTDLGSVPGQKVNHLPKISSKDKKNAPSDLDLMSSMMSRIAKLELQVKYYAKEIIEKDKRNNVLEEKLKLMQKYHGDSDVESQRVRELERKCQSLQEQIQDMEDFLSDYGMVWVGGTHADDDPQSSKVEGLYEDLTEKRTAGTESVWRPGVSVVSGQGAAPDFDLVLKNIRELNVLAGEGEKKIQHTVGGARFKTVDSIPLTLFANGIFMFSGPFRSYEEPETQRCMQDLMEGYFPSELQSRYPDGVPINVNDQRDTVFRDQRAEENFPGTGFTLGGDTDLPSRLVPSNLDKATSMESSGPPVSEGHTPLQLRETSKPPIEPMSVDQFLNKLRPTVTSDGKVLDIQSSVADLLREETIPNAVTVVDTPIVQDIRERAMSGKQGHGTERPLSARGSPRNRVTTLRVKSEKGDHTFILKLRFRDTIRDLRMHLDKERKSQSVDYDLVTTFPNRVYTELDSTLEENGLTPNATILVRLKKR